MHVLCFIVTVHCFCLYERMKDIMYYTAKDYSANCLEENQCTELIHA